MAYAVVPQGGLTGAGNYGFAHELGHVMGSHHRDDGTSFPYSHAHCDQTSSTSCPNGWATLMAGRTECSGHKRLRNWSNPNLAYCGSSVLNGGTALHDNARSLNQTRDWVSKFRCGTPPPNNVWMKDTWTDTGAEPDPAQAAAPMWLSPYIWVRNARDAMFEQQHKHENPQLGPSSNWVYVKLHNGGPTTSGELKLYYAAASTNLRWPGDWTPLASQPVSAFGANSSEIVEVEWSSLPGLGHYCLLARWVSAADPIPPPVDGPDVGVNTRGSNNIVWRNLHIVGLAMNLVSAADLMVGSSDSAAFDLEVLAPPNLDGQSFLRLGKLIVTLDKVLAKAAQAPGVKFRGLKALGKNRYLVDRAGAAVSGLKLDGYDRGRLQLAFQHPPTKLQYPVPFRVDVVQSRTADRQKLVLGGVSYEVQLTR